MTHASRALLTQAETVTPFTKEFNALIAELFPNDTRLLASLGSYQDTVCLLETSLHAIIQAFDPQIDSGLINLLDSAYLLKAGRTLFLRCKQVEREMPIY